MDTRFLVNIPFLKKIASF